MKLHISVVPVREGTIQHVHQTCSFDFEDTTDAWDIAKIVGKTVIDSVNSMRREGHNAADGKTQYLVTFCKEIHNG